MTDRQTSFGIVVSVGNSTTTPLGASAAFIGITESVLSFEEVTVNMYADPSTAPGSLYFEFSPDGTNWDVSVEISGAQITNPQQLPPQYLRVVLPFFRVRYINGTTPLTALRLTTIYHRSTAMRLTRFLNQTITDTEGVELTRSILSFKNGSGSYENVTASNELPVSEANSEEVVDQLQTLNSLVPSTYDYVSLGYTGTNLTTVRYLLGGSSGTLVSTLTLSYDGSSNLISVAKS